jgi:hypothetical protein
VDVKHKNQHTVPQSYLKAWCDPNCPEGHEPYIWICDKAGAGARKKAPAKVFTEKDFYTIRLADGERDLVLEHGLSQLESRFAALRANKLDKRLPLSPRDKLNLCAFVATMFARTKSRGEFWRGQWQRVLDLGERMQESMQEMAPEEAAKMARAFRPSPDEEDTVMTMDDVRELVEQPMRSLLPSEHAVVTPVLARMPHVIMETADSPGFVTSDAPCVWFDPEEMKESPAFGAGGLISPTIEISMPLSPRQCVFFGHLLLASGYVRLKPNDPMIDQMNMRVRHFADEYVVANQDISQEPWFVGTRR